MNLGEVHGGVSKLDNGFDRLNQFLRQAHNIEENNVDDKLYYVNGEYNKNRIE